MILLNLLTWSLMIQSKQLDLLILKNYIQQIKSQKDLIYLLKHFRERCDILKINESIIYNYTGKCQKITLEPGTYLIECYGAKGGGSTGANGDKINGYLKIGKPLDLYLYIGQQATADTGGWNGGATVTESGVYGGGGATDISLNGNDGSTIWNDSTHLDSIIIQAKGGQGQGKSGGATTGTYSNIRIDARTEYINRYGVHAAYIIPKVSGQLIFQSTNYSHDPYGFVDNANNVTSIYFREIPQIIFYGYENDNTIVNEKTGYTYINISDWAKDVFTYSAQGISAKDYIDSQLYNYSYCIEEISLTTIPIYYLEPNTRIFIYDKKSHIEGEYLIKTLSIPLQYNGLMSISATKAPISLY